MSITFTLKSFAIGETRSPHLDTDYAVACLRQNGTLYPAQAKKIGDVNNGNHNVGFTFPISNTYQNTDELTFSYMIINHGGGKTQDVLTRCENVMTQTPLSTFDPAGANIVTINGRQLPECLSTALRAKDDLKNWWNQVKHQFDHLDSNHCDGPVAIDRFSFKGQSLDQIILSDVISIIYLGMDSAVGCGSNSIYSVQWDVEVVALKDDRVEASLIHQG